VRLLIKEKLREFAKSIGIEKIGVAKDGENTVVVALFPYFVVNEKGNIAMYARGRDYHKINVEKLEMLSKHLLKINQNKSKINQKNSKKFEIYVDNAKMDDRKMAKLAGLG